MISKSQIRVKSGSNSPASYFQKFYPEEVVRNYGGWSPLGGLASVCVRGLCVLLVCRWGVVSVVQFSFFFSFFQLLFVPNFIDLFFYNTHRVCTCTPPCLRGLDYLTHP